MNGCANASMEPTNLLVLQCTEYDAMLNTYCLIVHLWTQKLNSSGEIRS